MIIPVRIARISLASGGIESTGTPLLLGGSLDELKLWYLVEDGMLIGSIPCSSADTKDEMDHEYEYLSFISSVA